VVLLLVVALTACSSNDDNGSSAANTPSAAATKAATTVSGSDSSAAATINAVEKDGSITLDKSSAKTGEVKFAIDNQGALKHEFVIIKTDLDPAALPQENGVVDEHNDQLKVIDEDEDIEPGARSSLSADLEPGKYVLICNISGHYQLGMHAPLTVQ
jgi:uncharacterized cupredoxin-like copper-binding protein